LSASRYNIDDSFLNEWSHDLAYFLGFAMADCSIIQNRCLDFGLNKKDIDVLLYFKQLFKTNKDIKFKKDSQSIYFRIYRKDICKKLKEYNIVSNRTGNEILPYIPEEFKYTYLLGLFDGDGCICEYQRKDRKSKRYIFTIVSGSKSFLDAIKTTLCKNFGKVSKKYGANAYEFRIEDREKIKELSILMYQNAPFYLNRKKVKFDLI
jgi:intein/homing endonuclease